MINLIDQKAEFNQNLYQFPSATANIAIFGSQSSGKSTLMNTSFGTNFPTLDIKKTRQQCTQGVWYQNVGKFNIIDTQGFDSIQRARQDSRIFQRQIALFSLAVSDVIMINIWMNQIGRYGGGHVGILTTVIKAASFLVKSQSKVLIFIVKDCSKDADTGLLKDQIQLTVQRIIKQAERQSKCTIKFNLQYYFMSHYIYDNQNYLNQAHKLPSQIKVRRSNLQQYQPKDRVVYLKHLWETIRNNEGEIDLRMQEQALKDYVVARIRNQVIQQIAKQIQQVKKLGKSSSYERFYQYYIKKSFKEIKIKLPKQLDQKTVKNQFFILQQQLQYVIHKHFDQVILPVEEEIILRDVVQKQLQKSYQSIQLQKKINNQRKAALQQFKFLVQGHKEANILIKRFAQKITESSVLYQRQVSHLFNMFQNKLEVQLNKELDSQLRKLKFDGDKISQKVKSMCKKFQYNQWEINLKEIWEKASHRILTQKLFDKIQIQSRRYTYGIWAGERQSQIIIGHKKLEKQCEQFINDLLLYFEEEDTGSQYYQKAKQKIRICLQKAIIKQKKRFRLSALILGIFLLFFYSQFVSLLKMGSFKKRNRNYFANAYFFIAVLMIIISILKRRSHALLAN